MQFLSSHLHSCLLGLILPEELVQLSYVVPFQTPPSEDTSGILRDFLGVPCIVSGLDWGLERMRHR